MLCLCYRLNEVKLKNIDWKGFEELVYKIQKLSFPGATVKFDEKVTDVTTEIKRQVDIAVYNRKRW